METNMNIDPNFVPQEQTLRERESMYRAVNYKYTKLDYAKDALAALFLTSAVITIVYFAFALDAIFASM